MEHTIAKAMATFKIQQNFGWERSAPELEGDFMKSDKQFVKIFKRVGAEVEEVGSINLKNGQSIYKIDENKSEPKAIFRVESNSGMPSRGAEFKGDFMKSDKQVSKIYNKGKPEDDEVAVIHLDKDQHVIKVKETESEKKLKGTR